jgi:hypothetical protein
MQLERDGSPLVTLRDATDLPRVVIGALDQGSHVVSMGDREGNVRVVLQVDAEGRPQFLLQGLQGKKRVSIGFDDRGPVLQLDDAEGRKRMLLTLDEQDQPGIFLLNDQGKVRVGLSSDEENHGLRILDSNDQGRVALTVNADERPYFVVHDSRNACRLKMTLLPTEDVAILLCNEEGHPELTLTTVKGSACLILSDRNAVPRAVLSMVGGKPTLGFMDEDGRPTSALQ